MIDFLRPFSVEISPTIYFGPEDLGDHPHLHRWRARWSFAHTGECDGIYLSAHPVLKATPCGVWINEDGYMEATKQPWEEGAPAKEWVPFNPQWMKKRFVQDKSGQGWAKPTREEALHSLAIRLTRWTQNIARENDKAASAAQVLNKLRPMDAVFAETAIKNLGGK
jgi:hypothetical protein